MKAIKVKIYAGAIAGLAIVTGVTAPIVRSVAQARAGGPIDPQARQEIDQMQTTYRRLSSLSLTGEAKVTGAFQMPGKYELVIARPNKFSYKLLEEPAKPGQSLAAVCDGKTVSTVWQGQQQYQTYPQKSGESLDGLAIETGVIDHTPVQLMTGTAQVLSVGKLKSLRITGTELLDGVDTDTVVADFNAPNVNSSGATLTLNIGREDHLVRRWMFSIQAGGNPQAGEIVYTKVRANVPVLQTTFKFTAPPGLTARQTASSGGPERN